MGEDNIPKQPGQLDVSAGTSIKEEALDRSDVVNTILDKGPWNTLRSM